MSRLLLSLLLLLSCPTLWAQVDSLPTRKKYETRGVWLTTVFNLDWPRMAATSPQGEERQRRELDTLLDSLRQAGINTVYLQTRGRGDLIYPSDIEPQSPSFTGRARRKLGYDPLAYAIEACHKRGMRLHAWIVTLPLGNAGHIRQLGKQAYQARLRSHCIYYEGEWYMDPASERTADHLASLVRELLQRYAVDGVHLDYIRYPSGRANYPDATSYRRARTPLPLREWREANITRIVSAVSQVAREVRPSVEVSIAPLGKYRSIPQSPNIGWTALESVHQNVQAWEQAGLVDALLPMLYYKDQLFFPYAEDWASSFTTPVILGLAPYRLLPREGAWHTDDVEQQISFAQRHPGIEGVCFFRAAQVVDPKLGIYQRLKERLFTSPALPYRGKTVAPPPPSPSNIETHETPEGLRLTWHTTAPPSYTLHYALYASVGGEVDRERGAHLIAYTPQLQWLIPWSQLPAGELLTFTIATYDLATGRESEHPEVHAYYRPLDEM